PRHTRTRHLRVPPIVRAMAGPQLWRKPNRVPGRIYQFPAGHTKRQSTLLAGYPILTTGGPAAHVVRQRSAAGTLLGARRTWLGDFSPGPQAALPMTFPSVDGGESATRRCFPRNQSSMLQPFGIGNLRAYSRYGHS